MRGPQTVGEIRGRATRMHPVGVDRGRHDDPRCARRPPGADGGARVAPAPGSRAPRFAQLLCRNLHPLDAPACPAAATGSSAAPGAAFRGCSRPGSPGVTRRTSAERSQRHRDAALVRLGRPRWPRCGRGRARAKLRKVTPRAPHSGACEGASRWGIRDSIRTTSPTTRDSILVSPASEGDTIEVTHEEVRSVRQPGGGARDHQQERRPIREVHLCQEHAAEAGVQMEQSAQPAARHAAHDLQGSGGRRPRPPARTCRTVRHEVLFVHVRTACSAAPIATSRSRASCLR